MSLQTLSELDVKRKTVKAQTLRLFVSLGGCILAAVDNETGHYLTFNKSPKHHVIPLCVFFPLCEVCWSMQVFKGEITESG